MNNTVKESGNGISNEIFDDEKAIKSNYAVQTAAELADVMSYEVYPIDIMDFIWKTLESMRNANDISFNDPDYAAIVLPLLALSDPDCAEYFISMTETLKKMQDAQGIVRKPFQIKNWVKTLYFQSEDAKDYKTERAAAFVYETEIKSGEISSAGERNNLSPESVSHSLNIVSDRGAQMPPADNDISVPEISDIPHFKPPTEPEISDVPYSKPRTRRKAPPKKPVAKETKKTPVAKRKKF